MTKATIEFDFNDSSDKLDFDMAMNSSKYHSFIHSLDNELRSYIKYDNRHLFGKECVDLYGIVDAIRAEISEVIKI